MMKLFAAGLLCSSFVLVVALPASARQTATTVNVIAGKPSEFGFKLSTKTVKHGAVSFKVTNSGAIPHTFMVCSSPKGGTANSCAGKGTAQLNPGQTLTLKITFRAPGTYEYLCSIPGHAAGGMKGDLKVT